MDNYPQTANPRGGTNRQAGAAVTSLTLLELVRSRDECAWRSLTQLYGPLIYHWCRKSGLSSEDAADVLQDVFGAIFLHIADFERSTTRGSFRGWLWTITRNRIRDHIKTQSRRAAAVGGTDVQLLLLEFPDPAFDAGADSAMSASDSLTYRAMRLVRSEIHETTWLAFWRTTIDGIAPGAVADELNVSIESVWQAKSRVLRRLRDLLA